VFENEGFAHCSTSIVCYDANYTNDISFKTELGYVKLLLYEEMCTIMDINGTSAGNNELSATVSGIVLDYDPINNEGYLTTISNGTLLGIYDANDNWWEALAAGVYTETPLMFVSDVTESEILAGLLGSTASAWSGNPVNFTFMGGYFLANDGNYHIWGTDLRSNNNGDIK